MCLLLAVGATLAVQHWVILPGFVELERNKAKRDLARVMDSIDREIGYVRQVAADWAAWDDTYRFVQDRNTPYIDSNFQWESLEASGINSLFVYNHNHQRVWGETYSSLLGGRADLDRQTLGRFKQWSETVQQSQQLTPLSGFMLTNRGPLMIVAYPVLTSEKKGPVRGALIMGRFLNARLHETIQQYTRVDFKLTPITKDTPEYLSQIVRKALGQEGYIQTQDEEWLNVFGVVFDIDKAPALLVEAHIHRDIMARGVLSARLAAVSILFTLLATLVVVAAVALSSLRTMKKANQRVLELVEERTRELAVATAEAEMAQVEASVANDAKSEFLANISHEIRTPLNGIIGLAQMASDTVTDVNQRNILSTILREADSLIALINDTLDLSRIEAGKLALDCHPFDCVQHLEDIACDVALRVDDRDIEVTCYVAPDVPRKVLGDRRRLRQVLLNLAYNALKFTEQGQVNLRMERAGDSAQAACQADECVLYFSVEDTGIGIPEEKQHTIFDRFSQADNSLSKRYKGAGLGTHIAQELVSMMDGDIGLESEEGVGSRFWFTAKVSVQAEAGTAVDWQSAQPGKRVLILDSCGSTCDILSVYLRAYGIAAEQATDLETAFDLASHAMLEDAPFDLLLIDEKFLLKERPGELGALPAVVLSRIGHTGVIDFNDLSLDVKGLLIKPLRWGLLKALLMTCLEGRKLVKKSVEPASAPANVSAVTVLLVEDYPTNQMVMMAHLQSAGYVVDLANNGEEAVAKCRQKAFDLILMDLQMPGMDGYETTKVIKNQRLSDAPIVAMSAHAMPEYREKCLAIGMADFLAKPVKRHVLIDKLNQWTQQISSEKTANLAKKTTLHYTEGSDNDGVVAEQRTGVPVAIFDYDLALDEFMGNAELLEEAVERFTQDTQVQCKHMLGWATTGELERIRHEAHKIKGGAASITAYPLSEAAASLEQQLMGASGSELSTEAFADSVRNLQQAFEQFAQAVEHTLGK